MGGRVRVPGDKSISHRALMFAALASGTSRVRGILQSDDVKSTEKAVERLMGNKPEARFEFIQERAEFAGEELLDV